MANLMITAVVVLAKVGTIGGSNGCVLKPLYTAHAFEIMLLAAFSFRRNVTGFLFIVPSKKLLRSAGEGVDLNDLSTDAWLRSTAYRTEEPRSKLLR